MWQLRGLGVFSVGERHMLWSWEKVVSRVRSQEWFSIHQSTCFYDGPVIVLFLVPQKHQRSLQDHFLKFYVLILIHKGKRHIKFVIHYFLFHRNESLKY